MHHVIVERWSRRASWLHSRDARAKTVATLGLVVGIATTPAGHPLAVAGFGAVLLAGAASARLPLFSLLYRGAFVLPFSAAFAAVSWLAGDPARAQALLWKSYLSAFAVLLLVASTPLVELLRALEWFRVPGLLVLIAQFLYRYLFVISEQAQHMRLAAQCRAGGNGGWTFRGAAAALSVLFVRSYDRADGIQRAMNARGFAGHFPSVAIREFTWVDGWLAVLTIALCTGVRVVA